MKKILLFILLTPLAHATTFYVDHIGGTRFSSIETTGLCDGTADTAPAGTTPDQHCAFNDLRYMWADGSFTDGSSFPGWGTVMSGGDTLIIKDCIQYSAPGVPIPGSSGSCRIGYSGPNSGDYFLAIAGGQTLSGAPPFPSGTAGAHTRILGANYASCTSPSAKALINAGYAAGHAFTLGGAAYVDVACLDISDHSSCGRTGFVNICSPSFPLDDYANTGIGTGRDTTNVTFTDLNIHGIASTCMQGPTGDGVSLLRVRLAGCNSSGYSMDNGDGITGTGTFTMSYSTIEWNGCQEEYPIVDALPYINCSDQNSGGYGDGIGTATITSSPAWLFNIDHSIVRYNTQDGFDLLHLQGGGSTLTVTTSLAYGNMGQQIKAGAASKVINNKINGNVYAMSYAIPGTPADTSAFSATEGLDVSFTGTLTNGSNVITGVTSTVGIQVGFYLYAGNSIGGSPLVTAVTSNTITFSGTSAETVTKTMDAADPVLTGVTPVSGTITPDMYFAGASLRNGSAIASYDSTAHTITMNMGIGNGGSSGVSFTQKWNSGLSLFGRAGNSAIVVAVSDTATTDIEFNTLYSANLIGWEIAPGAACTTACTIVFKNNIFFGFNTDLEPNGNGSGPSPIFLDPGVSTTLFTNSGSAMTNNATDGGKVACPDTGFGETNYLCTDPQLADESWHHYGYGNMGPASATSAVVGIGVAIPGITTDYNGTTRPNPPSMGALEFMGDPSVSAYFGGSITFSGGGVIQ